jgi:hypothetical protein
MSTSTDLTRQESFAPFFGDQPAAGDFVAAIYSHGNFIHPVNSNDNPEFPAGTLAGNVIFAKNYQKLSRVTNMNDDDIHNHFVDFIVNTARFHREIDKPSGTAHGLKIIYDSFTDAAISILDENVPLADIKTMLKYNDVFKQFPVTIFNNKTPTFLEFIDIILIFLLNINTNVNNIGNAISNIISIGCDASKKFLIFVCCRNL